MSNKPLNISESAAVQMPMKTVASLIALVAIGTWAFFSIQETLNRHTTTLELMEKDLEQNSEFRIKYPRGELGQSSGEAELFMLVEHMSGQLEKIIEKQENSMHNKVNIDRLQKDVEKILENIENLKDKVRNNGTGTQ
jgi:uncharacterized membrane protein YraQ (UPF0718 family)